MLHSPNIHLYTVRGPVISSVRRVNMLPKNLVYRVIWGITWSMVDCRPMMLSRVILGTTPGQTHHLEHG